jgi:hypothetical protein
LSTSNISHSSTQSSKLTELYEVEAGYENDLKTQFEQIEAFEAAAESGDWKQFKKIVNQSGKIFLKLMRGSDADPRFRLPLYQSGELEERFKKSLEHLNKDWAALLPWWARFGHRYRMLLTLASTGLALAAVRAAFTGTPGLGTILGAIVIAILFMVDNSEPGIGRKSRWWVRLIYPKPRAILNKWRLVVYVVAILFISWGTMAGAFKTATKYCEGLSPADIAVLSGCSDVLSADD